MGNGIGAVVPGDMQWGHNLLEDLVGKGRSVHESLVEAAVIFLKYAGIKIPHATVEVRGNEVIMHGVPEGSDVLVCALEGQNIRNYL